MRSVFEKLVNPLLYSSSLLGLAKVSELDGSKCLEYSCSTYPVSVWRRLETEK